jgi:hypothetical protein
MNYGANLFRRVNWKMMRSTIGWRPNSTHARLMLCWRLQREVRDQLIGTVQAMPEGLFTALGVRVEGLPYHQDEPLWMVIASMSYKHSQDHMNGLQKAMTA